MSSRQPRNIGGPEGIRVVFDAIGGPIFSSRFDRSCDFRSEAHRREGPTPPNNSLSNAGRPTRYDKIAANFLSASYLAAAVAWWL
jgi:hypothetical protein